MLKPTIQKNDSKAKLLIYLFSAVVFVAVVALKYIKLDVVLPFDKHIFAKVNAIINGTVSVTLLLALWAIKQRKYQMHKQWMMMSMILSIGFLLSYIAHHLLAGEAHYGGSYRAAYYFILITHIVLAATVLPFVLFSAYRALIGEYAEHKRIARWTWPIWWYVAVTGVVVYLMISPFYQ
jgi:putative membrane protein